jgi:Leucine-rich repeat (LRR) protein
MKWNIDDYTKYIQAGSPVNNEVTELILKTCRLEHIGQLNLPNLKKINCSNNNINNLNSLDNLYNLEELDCSYNRIETLENLNLPNLQLLKCAFNRILSLQNLNFPNLKYFHCSDNRINNIKDCDFTSLEEFYCFYNKIERLENLNFPRLKKIYCFSNLISEIHLNLPELRILDCASNKISSLTNIVAHNLEELKCYNNKIQDLEDSVFPNLKRLYCGNNEIVNIENCVFDNLEELNCYDNKIINIEDCVFPNLKILCCNNNQITNIQDINLPKLEELICRNNQIRNMVLLNNFPNLRSIDCNNNPIEFISPVLRRIMNKTFQNVYNDNQSVHNHNIQETVRKSINNIISIKPTIKNLSEYIINDTILSNSTKEILFEFINNQEVHSVLNITFEELLLHVFSRIEQNENTDEIKRVLNQEMHSSVCKCFTGRMSRLINSLSGFDELVNIQIADSEQIGNIIITIQKNMTNYNVDEHKELVRQE